MERDREIRKIVRVLKATKEAATEAALTGAYSAGGPMMARQYNALLEHLRELEALPSERLFPPMQEDVSAGEVAILCTQLAAYLQEEVRHEEGRQARVIVGGTGVDLGRLGRTIRENLPEWLQECCGETVECCGEAVGEMEETAVEPWEELAERMQELSERIRDEALSIEERAGLAREIGRLAREQAELLRQRGG